jgi:uncharacterized protein YbaR (Trm112 family)
MGKADSLATIGKDLLEIMQCPVAHVPLVQVGDWLYSTDAESRRKYPIRDGIPIMLVDESQVASPDEHQRALSEAGWAKREQGQ